MPFYDGIIWEPRDEEAYDSPSVPAEGTPPCFFQEDVEVYASLEVEYLETLETHWLPVMMKCGHAANAHDRHGKPVCAICIGIDPGATVVDSHPPGMEGRKARCHYYGRGRVPYKNECDICKQGQPCQCERPSSPKLAFFESRPGEPYDKFYCGCRGWD